MAFWSLLVRQALSTLYSRRYHCYYSRMSREPQIRNCDDSRSLTMAFCVAVGGVQEQSMCIRAAVIAPSIFSKFVGGNHYYYLQIIRITCAFYTLHNATQRHSRRCTQSPFQSFLHSHLNTFAFSFPNSNSKFQDRRILVVYVVSEFCWDGIISVE